MGVGSTTTNKCQLLDAMKQPIWHLTSGQFKIMWITTDCASLIIILVMLAVRLMRRHKATYSVETISLGSTSHGGTKIKHSPQTMKRKLLMDAGRLQDDDLPELQLYSTSPSADRTPTTPVEFKDIFQPDAARNGEQGSTRTGKGGKGKNRVGSEVSF